MEFEKVFCLFEQSGVFKNCFKKLGYEAYDIDLLNNYESVDYQLDIFKEVDAYFDKRASIFDKISDCDLIMSFFPCINFTEKFFLNASGKGYSHKKSALDTKIKYSSRKINEMAMFYDYFCKIVLIVLEKGIKMIVENPNANLQILKIFFPKAPSVIINDRTNLGDLYRKPTAFWFFNCEPSFNYIFENIKNDKKNNITIKNVSQFKKQGFSSAFYKKIKEQRSIMTPTFADRFIREFILEQEEADRIMDKRLCNT